MNQKLHTKKITSLTMLLNDQQVASGSLDGNIVIWDLMSKIPLSKLRVLSSANAIESENIQRGILSTAYNYQHHVLMSCGQDKRITFWDMNQGKAYRIIQASYDGDLNQISLSFNNQRVAVADDNGEVKVFGFNDGKLIYINNSHSYPVTSIRISPDSKTMISGDTSGAIFIWKL